ncbi:MAG: hypothetical protein WKG07_15030 [Hymenobacter sp.]
MRTACPRADHPVDHRALVRHRVGPRHAASSSSTDALPRRARAPGQRRTWASTG